MPDIAHQVRSEGAQTIVVMSDDIEKWSNPAIFPEGVQFIHRDELDAVQKNLREVEGTSVLIYDQTCATEKRRRRKRGKLEDPKKRVFINSLVCEGCGDCGKESFCVSVLPKETEYGRKREIDQNSCNKDYSCVKGFCPSFVTVHGGGLKKRKASAKVDFSTLPQPQFPTDLAQPWNILVTGIGGTGVVTIGALIGMAAHLEGKGATVLDQTGLAQKGGAVTCHLRIAKSPADIHAVRIAAGEADLVLGCDMVVVNDYWALSKIRAGRSRVVLNTYEAMPGTFTTKPDMQFPAQQIVAAVKTALDGGAPELVDATTLATALMGDSIASNLFMLGYAWQKGWVPLSLEALMRAVELNAAAVEMNKAAFNWGRLGAHDIAKVREAAGGKTSEPAQPMPLDDSALSTTLDDRITRRLAFLGDYQNAAYAAKYKALVDKVRAAEQSKGIRLERADRSGRALRVQADGLQGRIRSRTPVHQRRFRKARSRHFRRRLQAAFPSRPAAAGAPRLRRPSAQGRIWPLGIQSVQAAGEVARVARWRVRYFRLQRRTQAGASADR